MQRDYVRGGVAGQEAADMRVEAECLDEASCGVDRHRIHIEQRDADILCREECHEGHGECRIGTAAGVENSQGSAGNPFQPLHDGIVQPAQEHDSAHVVIGAHGGHCRRDGQPVGGSYLLLLDAFRAARKMRCCPRQDLRHCEDFRPQGRGGTGFVHQPRGDLSECCCHFLELFHRVFSYRPGPSREAVIASCQSSAMRS